MGRILNLFGRSVSLEKGPEIFEDDNGEVRARRQSPDYDALGIEDADVEIFEALAETQQSIEGPVSSVIDGLAHVQGLAAQMSALQRNFAALFEDYRGMTVASLKLGQDRERLNAQYREKAQEVATLRNESAIARGELESARAKLSQAQNDVEVYEKRTHLLEMSKRETEQELAAATSGFRGASEEAESYKMELAALRQQVEVDSSQIAQLSAKHQEAYERALLLTDRCASYENTLKASYEQISILQGNIENLSQQRDSLQQYAQHKDVETAQLRSDLSKSFEKFQGDLQAKERDIAAIRAENENSRSSAKIHEQVSLELKFDNEAKAAHIRHQEEAINKFKLAVSTAEAKLVRLGADLDAALTAKAQTDQSRAAMASRVESVAQSLRAREADVHRLENLTGHLTAQLEEHGTRSRSTVETLEAKVFELEKDLSAQKNATAYYYAQVELLKKPENRGA